MGWALGVALALALAGACRDDTPQEVALDTGGTAALDFGECEPGAELPCTCVSGAAGTQVCLESGYERTGCICEAPPVPSADTGATTSGTGGTSSGTGAGTGTGGSSSSGPGLDSSGGG